LSLYIRGCTTPGDPTLRVVPWWVEGTLLGVVRLAFPELMVELEATAVA
jgi:hypothetical protein